jgi:hypothetical protein
VVDPGKYSPFVNKRCLDDECEMLLIDDIEM